MNGHRLLSRQSSCPEATAIHILDIPGWVFVFQQNGASSTRHRHFPGAKGTRLIPPTMWLTNSLDLNPFDYICSTCSVLQEKVYPSRIANVDELKTHLIDEWEHFHQPIVDAAVAEWRRCLRACVRVRRAHFEHQFQ